MRQDCWPGRLVPDASLQVIDDGRVLIGGSPLTVLRFSEPIDLDALGSTAIADRLVDTGMAHPEPTCGPWSATEVTVVIPVYGHVDALAATLAALTRGGDRFAGVVVVDDGSPDPDGVAATVALAGSSSIRLIRLDENRGAAGARNAGLKVVHTPLVAFLDAGCVPEPGWLAPLLAHFVDPSVALVAPRVRADATRWSDAAPAEVEPSAGPVPATRRVAASLGRRIRRAIARYETRRSSLDLGPVPARVAPRTRVAYVPSACVLARTDAVGEIGGFDETMRVGEDVDVVWRLAETHRLRYEPGARATHDVRTRPSGFLGRRFAYGTSAAPLSRRHPRGPVPVQVSGWSAAAWGAVAFGHIPVGVAVAAGSTALLARKLQRLDHPVRVAVRLAGVGNLAAGGLLANAIRRAWWPAAFAGVFIGPRSLRRTVAAAFLIPPLIEWRLATGLDPLTWLVFSTADDLAYGAGVWAGCVRNRTVRPLVPDLSAGRVD